MERRNFIKGFTAMTVLPQLINLPVAEPAASINFPPAAEEPFRQLVYGASWVDLGSIVVGKGGAEFRVVSKSSTGVIEIELLPKK